MCRTLSEYEAFLKNEVGVELWNAKTFRNFTEGLMETLKDEGRSKSECFQTSYSNSSYTKGSSTLCCWVARFAELMALNTENLTAYRHLVERVIFSVGKQQIIYNSLEDAERFLIPIGYDYWHLQIEFKDKVPEILVGMPILFRSYFICDCVTRDRFIKKIMNYEHWPILNFCEHPCCNF